MKRLLILFFTVTITQCFFAQSITSKKRIVNDTVYIDLSNPFLAPMEITISPLDSTKTYTKVNSYGILRHKDTLKNALVIPLSKIADTSSIKITNYINFKGNFGDPNSNIDEDYLYTFPFPKQKKYKIIQSFGGKFSHNRPHSKYAIDFGTKVGDTITAIRDGIVFFVKEDSKEHCRTRKCVDKANKVLILHDDGTMAHYVHLDYQGAIVSIGDRVSTGQAIGISGMTGFTTIPHLHLVMYKSGGNSIPFFFKGYSGKKLKQGKYYRRRL